MNDDQGYGDLACHGNSYIETPHLDRLYSESVRFTNFHLNPFFAPTRAALMTGRFSEIIPTDVQAIFKIPVNKGDIEIQAWLIDSVGYGYPACYVYVFESSQGEVTKD